MSNLDPLDDVQNPHFRALAKWLRDELPQYLEEKERKRLERREFVRQVWEKACNEAGIIERKLMP